MKYIGVDLHTENFVACFIQNDKVIKKQKYLLSESGLDCFFAELSRSDELAVEATANASYFVDCLSSKVNSVTVVAPSEFAVIGKSVKKTDLNDAHKLSLFLSKGLLPKARLKKFVYQQLASLIDTRTLLLKARMALSHKVCSITVRFGIKVSAQKITRKRGFEKYIYNHRWDPMVEKELKIIERQIRSLSAEILEIDMQIDNYSKDIYGYENLLSIAGIGKVSAPVFLSVIADINDFPSPAKLASYFGIVPKIRESNDNGRRGSITKKGDKAGRAALIQCTWIAIRFSPYLNSYYERLKKGKGARKAIVATSRKYLAIIYRTLKNDWVFEDFPNYKYHVRAKRSDFQQIHE